MSRSPTPDYPGNACSSSSFATWCYSKYSMYISLVKSSLFRSKVDPDRISGPPGLNNNNNKVSSSSSDFKMNLLVALCVFLLGVLSAIFLSLWTLTPRDRKALFQPLPHVEHLQIAQEGYPEGSLPFGIDPDGECDGENALGLELEAVGALHAAIEMREQGKTQKAQKLFQHAIALCPRHPDILTHFGEFLEKSQEDLLTADHLYLQALTYSPGHSKAIANRKRTSPVVDELDDRRLRRIDEKRDLLLQMPDSSAALPRVKKEAYFQHLYHTAGIEGNTMTLSETRFILETKMAVGGKSLLEHNEILGLDYAMKYINVSLVHRIGAITREDILQIHRHLMAYVSPDEAGRLRTNQVFVGSHIPCSPSELEEQINSLTEWLNSDDALTLHPIHYAALAHYKLVYIHPFLDGNGRTSRLLMNWILMQAGYPPVIIRKQDRQLYYEHLNTANKGDVRPFIRFIADATEKTVDVYLWSTRELGYYRQILGHSEGDEPEVTSEAPPSEASPPAPFRAFV